MKGGWPWAEAYRRARDLAKLVGHRCYVYGEQGDNERWLYYPSTSQRPGR